MSKVQIMDHPLIQHKVNYIRRKEVGSKEFREIVGEIAALMQNIPFHNYSPGK